MSTGHGYRALETSTTAAGTGGSLDLDGSSTGFQTLVAAIKEITAVGTGPWSVVLIIEDGTNWEEVECNLEEGTGGGGKDRIRRDTGTIRRSSNGGAPVNWGSGTKDVYLAGDAAKLYALLDAPAGVSTGMVKKTGTASYEIKAVSAFGEAWINQLNVAVARAYLVAETSVMTTRGDLIYRGASVTTRLPKGTLNQYLKQGTNDPAWGNIQVAELPPAALRGYLDGYVLTPQTAPTYNLSFAAGLANASGNDYLMERSSALVKQLNNTWVQGTNQGGRPSAISLSDGQWWHCFIIANSSSGVIDAGFDTNVDASQLLAAATGFDKYRRVGSVYYIDATSRIQPFTQRGDRFWWLVPALEIDDIDGGAGSEVTDAVHVPPGVAVEARLNVSMRGTAERTVFLGSPDMSTIPAASTTAAPLGQVAIMPDSGGQTTVGSSQVDVYTDTSQQIVYRTNASNYVRMSTLGWRDDRGRDA